MDGRRSGGAPVALLGVLLALALPGPAGAKGFERLVVVGAAGDAAELRSAHLVASLNDGASRFNRGHVPRAVQPRGPYVRLYPLGRGGFVGVPGRFYPHSGAVCLSWDQSGAPGKPCYRPNPTLRRALLRRARELSRFRGAGPALRRLASPLVRPALLTNLRVALELAFDRHGRAVPSRRPARCVRFRAAWRDDGGRRPRAFCLSPRGVYVRGLLYPLGPAPYGLARAGRR